MGKAVKCKILFHGSYNQFESDEFPSKAAAKRYIYGCGWSRPYTIKPLN